MPSRKKHFQRMAINAKIASMNYDAAADWTLEQIKSTLAYCRQAPERNQDEYFQYLLKLRNAIILLRNFDNYDLEAIMQGNESPEHASQTKEQKLNATFKNLDNLHNMLINLDTKNFSQEISVKIDNFRNNLIALQQDTLNNQITDDERKELARDMHHEYVSEILPAILKSKWGDESINTDCFLVKLLDVSQQYPILQSLQ